MDVNRLAVGRFVQQSDGRLAQTVKSVRSMTTKHDFSTFGAAKVFCNHANTDAGGRQRVKVWKSYLPANAWGEEKPVFRVADRKPEGDWIGPMVTEWATDGYSTED